MLSSGGSTCFHGGEEGQSRDTALSRQDFLRPTVTAAGESIM